MYLSREKLKLIRSGYQDAVSMLAVAKSPKALAYWDAKVATYRAVLEILEG